jgi:hypothetical protein
MIIYRVLCKEDPSKVDRYIYSKKDAFDAAKKAAKIFGCAVEVTRYSVTETLTPKRLNICLLNRFGWWDGEPEVVLQISAKK